MKLTFRRAEGECCALCNWPALADLESEAVRVELVLPGRSADPRSICLPCIDALAFAAKHGRAVVSVDLDPELVEFLRARGGVL